MVLGVRYCLYSGGIREWNVALQQYWLQMWLVTHAMQLHLRAISDTVASGAHAAVLMDRAGWHTTLKLNVPDNITIILLPPKSPELNPVENIWRYMRQNWLSARVFPTYEAILDAGCDAWNRLIDQPQTIKSIGSRKWAYTGQS